MQNEAVTETIENSAITKIIIILDKFRMEACMEDDIIEITNFSNHSRFFLKAYKNRLNIKYSRHNKIKRQP